MKVTGGKRLKVESLKLKAKTDFDAAVIPPKNLPSCA
jgi:hypothetical protein